jgi:hypothetical protein
LIIPASIKNYSLKELSKLAKAGGIAGYSGMSKEQLVKAVTKLQKSKPVAKKSSTPHSGINGTSSKAAKQTGGKLVTAKSAVTKAVAAKASPAKSPSAKLVANKTASSKAPMANSPAKVAVKTQVVAKRVDAPAKAVPAPVMMKAAAPAPAKPKPKAEPRPKALPPPLPVNPVVQRKIHEAHVTREQSKDLSRMSLLVRHNAKVVAPERDRVVLMVRDPFWLHACWELTRQTVERAKAAMAEHWHTAQPILRLYDVEIGATTNTSERIARDIPIHGGVTNWYIDVANPPRGYRVDIGYLGASGKYYPLAKSNSVSTPAPGAIDTIDNNWMAVAENYERVYAMSGGYSEEGGSSELQELFEERLRRPMGAPVVTRFGAGAERSNGKDGGFRFEVDAEMILFGSTKPDAHVTLSGEPVKLREDGTFTVRLSMPDKRQVLPVVASSADGIETRTVVVAIERNTKVMEPMVKDSNE